MSEYIVNDNGVYTDQELTHNRAVTMQKQNEALAHDYSSRYKQPSMMARIGETTFNLGRTNHYWLDKDPYGIGRLLAFSAVGLTVATIGIVKLVKDKDDTKKEIT